MRKFLVLVGALFLFALVAPEAAKVRNDSLTPKIVRSSITAASFCNNKECYYDPKTLRGSCVPGGDNKCFISAGQRDCISETCN